MRIEHFALQVADPAAMADWYVRHLGFRIARAGGAPVHARFLLEHRGAVMLELYRNPRVTVPDYAAMDPLHLHLAFVSENPASDCERLARAGARVVEPPAATPAGDVIAMLRDPWGLCVQLVQRASPMLKTDPA